MGKFRSILLTIATVFTVVQAQCSVERATPFFKRAVYEFSSDLVSRIGQETDYHFVSSPLSIWAMISFASLGSEGQTLFEIRKVLKHHPNTCLFKQFFDIVRRVTKSDDDTVLERSSALFVDNRMPITQSFRKNIVKAGVCDINTIPFDNFESAATAINEYVSQNTHGNIEEIVTSGDLAGVYLLLVDALYFKGNWKTPFSPSDTEPSQFYDEKGRPIGDVNLMFVMADFQLATINQIQSQVLELPYGKNERFSMLIFLPKNQTISYVLENLTRTTLSSIFAKLATEGKQTTSVQMPRFKMSSELENLKELLNDMGLKAMFESNEAEFSDLSDYSVYISNLIQKAELEVNEEGTTASASTGVEFSSRSMPQQIILNKPFLFMIVDKVFEVPLFMGVYSKPSIF